MTTKKFAQYIEKQCKGINNFSLEAIFEEYIVLVSGKRIGVLYQEKFYVLYAPTFEKTENILPCFKSVNLFNWKYYQFIEVTNLEDKEKLEKIIHYVYHELYFLREVVIDIGFLFQSYRGYPETIYKLYEENLTFLNFAYEKKLIKENPVDRDGRMIKLLYTNLDLTETGQKILYDLYNKWLTYTDKNDADSLKRARNIKQLEKYYQKFLTTDYDIISMFSLLMMMDEGIDGYCFFVFDELGLIAYPHDDTGFGFIRIKNTKVHYEDLFLKDVSQFSDFTSVW